MAGRLTLLTMVAALIAACQTSPADKDRPARIVHPDDAGHEQLQRVLDDILHTTVTIARDALTESSVLIIERRPPRGIQNHPAGGRVMDAPLQFQLVKNGRACILIDQRDQTRYTLTKTHCEPEQ